VEDSGTHDWDEMIRAELFSKYTLLYGIGNW